MKHLVPPEQPSESILVGCLLAASGGLQDAYTYNVRDQVFANAQTGNMVLVGQSLALGQWAVAAEHLIPVVAFATGVFAAEAVRNRFHSHSLAFHWRQAVVLLEAVILLLVAFLPSQLNLLANVLVSFVCAMQVESFRKIEGNAYATTMCIGNLRSGMEYLYRWHVTRDRAHLHRAKVYYLVILVFVLGAALGGVTCRSLGRLSILICCPLLLSAVAVMAWTKRSAEHGKKKVGLSMCWCTSITTWPAARRKTLCGRPCSIISWPRCWAGEAPKGGRFPAVRPACPGTGRLWTGLTARQRRRPVLRRPGRGRCC